MDISTLRKELNDMLGNIVKHSESFPANRPIPSLEVSAIISKVNKLQERLAVLKYLLEVQENQHKITSLQEQTLPPKEELIMPENTVFKTNTTEQVAEKEVPAIEIPQAVQQDEQNEEPQETIEKQLTIVVDDVKIKQEIAQKLSKTPIKSLKEAFSLNDRYLYANELFEKNMEAFNNFITTIDESGNINEAKEKLAAAKTQYSWDEENNFYLEFTILVERRFS